VDTRARESAPSLPYDVGELVRIDGEAYRRFSAAICTFGDEVVWRLLRGVGLEPHDLTRWQQNYALGA
jgi:hypothetical protein